MELERAHWMPPNYRDQLKLGVEVIQHSFDKGTDCLGKKIVELKGTLMELAQSIDSTEARIAKYKQQADELRNKNKIQERENEEFSAEIRKLRVENARAKGNMDTLISSFEMFSPIATTKDTTYRFRSQIAIDLPSTAPKGQDRTQDLIQEIDDTLQARVESRSALPLKKSSLFYNPNFDRPTQRSIQEEGKFSPSTFVQHISPQEQIIVGPSFTSQRSRTNTSKILHSINGKLKPKTTKKYIKEDKVHEEPGAGKNSSPRSVQYIEGKRFFSRAREELEFAKFQEFLQEVQKLNRGKQSKEETLLHVSELFGKKHTELFSLFQQLIKHKGF